MAVPIPRPLKVLIVDDDKTFNHALEFRLSKAGFMTEAVFDGAAALKAFEKSHFDLVVLDLVMPGMAGFEVLAEIRKKDATVPVAVLSLLHQEDDIERATKLGASNYLSKSSASFMDDVVKYAEKISAGAV